MHFAITDSSKTFDQTKSSTSNLPSRLQIATWTAISITAIVVMLWRYPDFQLGTYRDDARYAVLAESLTGSRGYGLIHTPGEPAEARFPFAYPLLLSLILRVAPGEFGTLKYLSLAATVVNTGLLFWLWPLLGRRGSHWWGTAVCALYALSPLVVDHSRMVMSEPIFLTFCLVAMALAEQLAAGSSSLWRQLALSVALVLALFTRTIGVALVVTILLYLFVRSGRARWRHITLIPLEMLATLGAVVLFTTIEPRDLLPLEYLSGPNALVRIPSVASLLSPEEADRAPGPDLPDDQRAVEWAQMSWQTRLVINARYWVQQHLGLDIRAAVLPLGAGEREQAIADAVGLSSLPLAVGFTISGLIVAGSYAWLRRSGASAFMLFAACYFAFLMLWTWFGTRLLYPVLPQLHLSLLAGVELVGQAMAKVARRFGHQRWQPHWVVAAAVILIGGVSAFKSLRLPDSRTHTGDLALRTAWLRANTTPADVIMTNAPTVDYLYTGRQTVAYPPTFATLGQLEHYIAETGAVYVLIAPRIRWQQAYAAQYDSRTAELVALLDDDEAISEFELVYSQDSELIHVYRIRPGG